MPKSSLPALVFNGVSLSIIRQNNQTYFSASDIAKSLGYQSDDAISRIYRRNSDEFTKEMSETVNLTVSGNIQKTVRLFSLRGAHLVAMFSRTPIAKEFRRWVLDVLDRETSQRTLIQDIDVKSLLLENHFELTVLLTRPHINRYAVRKSPEKNGVGIAVPDLQRRTTAGSAVFFRPLHGSFMGKPCGASSDAPGSFVTGTATCTVSPTRLQSGSEFKTLQRSQS